MVLMALLVGGAAISLGAAGESSSAILAADGPGWMLVELRNVSAVVLSLDVKPGAGASAGQMIYYEGIDFQNPRPMTLLVGDGGTWAYVDAEETGAAEVRLLRTPIPGAAFSVRLASPTETARVLVWAAGVEDFSLSVTVEGPSAEISRLAQADGAFISDGTAWETPEPAVTLNRGPRHVSYVQDARLHLEIKGAFIGIVGEPPLDPLYWEEDVRLTDPLGVTRACPCYLTHLDPHERQGPGIYALDRSAFGVAYGAGIPLAGVDVVWP